MAIRWGRVEMVRLLWDCMDKSGNLDLNNDGSGDSPFIAAVARLPDIAHLMIATGKVQIESRNTNGDTALTIAARKGDIALVETILALGADHSSSDSSHRTPLSLACGNDLDMRGKDLLVSREDSTDRLRTVEILVSQGARIEAPDGEEQTPLHHAVRSGYMGIIKVLVSHGANVNARAQNGSTPLIWNAEDTWDFEIARFLVEQGADVSAFCGHGFSALCYSHLAKNPVKLAQFLLQQGASVGDHPCYRWHNVDYGHRNVLHRSVECPELELTELFLDHGANINCIDRIHGTPLMTACNRSSSFAIIKLLVDRGADVNLAWERDHSAPLGAAIEQRCGLDIIKLLLDKGADPEGKAGWGLRALHSAVSLRSFETAEMLIQYGASPDRLDDSNRNCLYYAAEYGDVAMLELLDKHGAVIEHACGPDDELLTNALFRGCTDEGLEWLVRKGADVNKHGRHGETALHMVMRARGLQVIKTLLDHGAEFDVKNFKGETPLDFISLRCKLAVKEKALSINCGSGRLLLESSWVAELRSVPLLLKVLDVLISYKHVRASHDWRV
ncbi:unnamed protein product [Clonostachys byssicola]|uniref:Uncharacterized protein n=1 Tax=Clonostachys byssicola TaxID=160290 RepID=A0A9N9UJT4_9HYPO|nr:unnamed protein product [Clonostachys byssicola]